MSTNSREQQQDTPPEGYLDIIMTTQEARLVERAITSGYSLSTSDDVRSRIQSAKTQGPYPLLDNPTSDLVRYRVEEGCMQIITEALSNSKIITSTPLITAKAKEYYAKQHYSIVYLPEEETRILRILPEFSQYQPLAFSTTGDDKSERLCLRTGYFSPVDMSCLKDVGVEEISKGSGKEALYCSTLALNVASTKPSENESEESATKSYELILTAEQLMRLRIELNHRQPLTRTVINGVNVAVVYVNLTVRQAALYRSAFDLVHASNSTRSPIVLCSRDLTALFGIRDSAATSRARYSLFSTLMAPSVMGPLVGLGSTLWVLNYLSPAFHQMLPSMLGMILGATATPYVLAILTVLVIAALWCQNNPTYNEASEDTSTSCFSMC